MAAQSPNANDRTKMCDPEPKVVASNGKLTNFETVSIAFPQIERQAAALRSRPQSGQIV